MTVNEKIIETLSPFGKKIKKDWNEGNEKEYFAFNYIDDEADAFGDDEPLNVTAGIQIHYFIPANQDYFDMKKKIRRALLKSGFTYPTVTMTVEEVNKTRHLIFECEIEDDEELIED